MGYLANYFASQEKFNANIIEAYKDGKLSAGFQPYFEWKSGGALFSRTSLHYVGYNKQSAWSDV